MYKSLIDRKKSCKSVVFKYAAISNDKNVEKYINYNLGFF